MIPFHMSYGLDDDDVQWAFDKLLTDVIDEHAPVKTRKRRDGEVPYMNSKLRRVMYKKRMAKNAHNKDKKNDWKWNVYKKYRNEYVSLKWDSINNFFSTRCQDGPQSVPFWRTVGPFMTDKGNSKSTGIMLNEDGEIICNCEKVCDIFNSLFVDIAQDIGRNVDITGMTVQQILDLYKDHQSVQNIKEKFPSGDGKVFSIRTVSEHEVCKELKRLNVRKASGYDLIPAKLLKMAVKPLSVPLTQVINHSIIKRNFPSDMKKAEVSPVFKKENKLDKTKYRPVSVLVVTSKIYERLIASQTADFFENILNPYMSAYRKGYNCEHVLLKAVEGWKRALDKGEYVGAILMDLSKAFDSIPNGLLIAKLHAYGVDDSSCELFMSYLRDRKQRVKIGNIRSEWVTLRKGVPQGSILGPNFVQYFQK
jgi:hypothetical protein